MTEKLSNWLRPSEAEKQFFDMVFPIRPFVRLSESTITFEKNKLTKLAFFKFRLGRTIKNEFVNQPLLTIGSGVVNPKC